MKKAIKSKYWVLGSLIGLGTVPTLIKALSGVKMAIVYPIFGSSIFIAAILGFIFLKEKLSNYEIVGIFFLFLGVVLVIL